MRLRDVTESLEQDVSHFDYTGNLNAVVFSWATYAGLHTEGL